MEGPQEGLCIRLLYEESMPLRRRWCITTTRWLWLALFFFVHRLTEGHRLTECKPTLARLVDWCPFQLAPGECGRNRRLIHVGSPLPSAPFIIGSKGDELVAIATARIGHNHPNRQRAAKFVATFDLSNSASCDAILWHCNDHLPESAAEDATFEIVARGPSPGLFRRRSLKICC